VQIPAIHKKAEKEVHETKVNILLQRFIEQFELTGGIKHSFIYPSVKTAISDKNYKLGIDSGESLVLHNMEDQAPLNEGKTGFITLAEFVRDVLKKENVLKQSNAPSNAGDFTGNPMQTNSFLNQQLPNQMQGQVPMQPQKPKNKLRGMEDIERSLVQQGVLVRN